MSSNSNFDAQYDELAALAAIFADSDTFEFSPLDSGDASGADSDAEPGIGWQGHILIDPSIPSPPLTVSFAADGPQHGTTVIAVESLPPIELHFSLPAGYPTAQVPQLQVFSDWAPFALLADMTAAADRAAQSCLAVESPALFDVYDAVVQVLSTHLSSATPTDSASDDGGGGSFQVESREALKLIHAHDQSMQAARLASEPYTCLICLDTHPGESAVVLPGCMHRFCRACIIDFFTVLINEGMPRQVKCPHPDCSTKPSSSTASAAPAPSSSRASNPAADVDHELASAMALLAIHPIQPSYLAPLLGPDLASKFTTHYLSRAYASDPSMHWCPVPACGGPARGHPAESTYAKLATCLRCQFSFCIHCSRAYHGSAQHCDLKNADEVVDEYFAAMELAGQAARDRQLAPLFVKYGRTVVERLAKEREAHEVQEAYSTMVHKLHAVDLKTRTWVRENATACPKCGVRVIRVDGCAHMTCAMCSESFCIHCGEVLEGEASGSHYSNKATKCFRRMYG